MALAKEIMGGGLSAGQAQAIGGQAVSLAGTGTVQGDAAEIKSSIVIATGADGTVGLRLPAGQVGDEIWVFNNAASTMKVWPNAGAAITVAGTGLGSADTAFSQLTYKCTIYKCQSSTQWFANTTA